MLGYRNRAIRNFRRTAGLSVLFLAAPLAAFPAGAAPVARQSDASIAFADHGGIRDWCADGSKGLRIQASSGHNQWSSIPLQHDEQSFFRTLQPGDGPQKKVESVTSTAVRAEPPSALNLTPPPINQWLLSAPLQVLVSDIRELPAAEAMPEIVVESSTTSPLSFGAPNPPCGIAGVAWSFAHPADAWRELAPRPTSTDTVTCLRSAAVVEHLPDALESVRWYQ